MPCRRKDATEDQSNDVAVQDILSIIDIGNQNNIAAEKTYEVYHESWKKEIRFASFEPRQAQNIDSEKDRHYEQFRRDEYFFFN